MGFDIWRVFGAGRGAPQSALLAAPTELDEDGEAPNLNAGWEVFLMRGLVLRPQSPNRYAIAVSSCHDLRVSQKAKDEWVYLPRLLLDKIAPELDSALGYVVANIEVFLVLDISF
ncbi:hypothetical protein KCV07_g235, partial [Aureobasidium melanogenum]